MTFEGIGPILIGGSLSAPVSDALTEETSTETSPERCRFFTGDRIDPLVISSGVTPDVIDGVYLPAKDDSTGYPRTPEGIGTGMTVETLLATYPEAIPAGPLSPPSYAITNGAGRYLHFTVDEADTISGIYLEVRETLTWEYCF